MNGSKVGVIRVSRNLLHVNQLVDFIGWLNSKYINNRPGNGYYEVLQVQVQKQWFVICKREGRIEHLSVPPALESLVMQFIRFKRETNASNTMQKIKELLGLPADCSNHTVLKRIQEDVEWKKNANLQISALFGCSMSDPGRQRPHEGRWTTINAPTTLVNKLREFLYEKEGGVLPSHELSSDRGTVSSTNTGKSS